MTVENREIRDPFNPQLSEKADQENGYSEGNIVEAHENKKKDHARARDMAKYGEWKELNPANFKYLHTVVVLGYRIDALNFEIERWQDRRDKLLKNNPESGTPFSDNGTSSDTGPIREVENVLHKEREWALEKLNECFSKEIDNTEGEQ